MGTKANKSGVFTSGIETSKSLTVFMMLTAFASNGYSMGTAKPNDPVATPTPAPTPAPTPKPTPTPVPKPSPSKRSFGVHGLVDISTNFDLGTLSMPSLKPSCLKSSGIELIAIDPGHDDSSSSRRSDAKVRGGNGKYVFLWPKVHEGQLNMVTSLLAAHYMVSNPALSESERKEMEQMVRLSRYPGEKRFGEYELDEGYVSSSVGSIDHTVTNRRERVNQMLRQHRPFTGSTAKGWGSTVKNVQERALFLSVHANSTEYFDEGDFGWMIPPNSSSVASKILSFQNALAGGFGFHMFNTLKPRDSDDDKVYRLKKDIYQNYEASKIRKGKHSTNLAMLSTSLGTSNTVKVLSEGFVMNGKAGHIAHLELNDSTPMLMQAYRDGDQVQEYGVSSIYDAYARSIVAGIANFSKCN